MNLECVCILFIKKHLFVLVIFGLLLLGCSLVEDDPSFVPELTTTSISEITSSTANCGGNISSNGGEVIKARGVCYCTNQSPTVSDNLTDDGTGDGVFQSKLIGLTPDTKYYVRAYAINSVGTGYGNEIVFTTEPDCELICDINTETYAIIITCESGGYSTTYINEKTEYEYDSYSKVIGIKLHLSRTRTYLNSNNTYTITGLIEVDLIKNIENHDITVSGGNLINPLTCN